uniref:Uncharacterized protein n=1 Tax=Strigamia maritima TaxID=126957 RepID=T1JLH2_STRMM
MRDVVEWPENIIPD